MLASVLACVALAVPADTIVVGSKNFPESRLLGEILALLIEEHTEHAVEHRASLGGTLVCWTALVEGEIDLYPEYAGTAWVPPGWTCALRGGGALEISPAPHDAQ